MGSDWEWPGAALLRAILVGEEFPGDFGGHVAVVALPQEVHLQLLPCLGPVLLAFQGGEFLSGGIAGALALNLRRLGVCDGFMHDIVRSNLTPSDAPSLMTSSLCMEANGVSIVNP